MDIWLAIVMLVIGIIGSFFSGLLGIGGAIINYPLLLFVPAAIGVASFTGQEVSSISMFQVFFASLAGMIAFQRRKKNGAQAAPIHRGLVVYMGTSILIGSLVGGYLSGYLDSDVINMVYGVLAIVAVILMLIPNNGSEQASTGQERYNRTIAVLSALLVGVVSGIVGAGGAFILIPIMLTVLRIPTRVTISTSLAIVFLSAIGGVIGKLTAGHLIFLPTLFTVIGSLIGAPIGSSVSSKLDVKVLRYALIILISLTAVKVWASIL